MTKIFIMFTIFIGIVLVSCSGDAGTENLPQIKVTPSIISFEDNDLYKGVKTNPKYMEISNVGEGDLEISKIAFTDLPADMEMTYFIEEIGNTPYAQVKYPIVLKKDEKIIVSVVLIPQDEGMKTATIEIRSNSPEDKVKKVTINATNFVANIKVNEVMKAGGDYVLKDEDPLKIKVKQCVPAFDQRTLINICNVGKAVMVINDIKLEGDALAKEYFEIEPLNTPAKLPGAYTEDGMCITGLALCHNGDPGMSAKLIIKNTSDNFPQRILELESE